MEVLIEMPLERYDTFVNKCHPLFREYHLLTNASFIRRRKDDHFERAMQIFCDLDQARRLRDLAIQIYPAAVPDIEKAISAPRDS